MVAFRRPPVIDSRERLDLVARLAVERLAAPLATARSASEIARNSRIAGPRAERLLRRLDAAIRAAEADVTELRTLTA
jgi:hypothetical protein